MILLHSTQIYIKVLFSLSITLVTRKTCHSISLLWSKVQSVTYLCLIEDADADILSIEFGLAKSLDLIPDGSNVTVTRENRLQYIHLISHYRLSKQIKLQSEYFFEGLSEMIDPKWLR